MKTKDLIKKIEEDGWVFKRVKGDHRMYYKAGARRPLVIPGKMSDEIPIGTLQSILREAGLK